MEKTAKRQWKNRRSAMKKNEKEKRKVARRLYMNRKIRYSRRIVTTRTHHTLCCISKMTQPLIWRNAAAPYGRSKRRWTTCWRVGIDKRERSKTMTNNRPQDSATRQHQARPTLAEWRLERRNPNASMIGLKFHKTMVHTLYWMAFS